MCSHVRRFIMSSFKESIYKRKGFFYEIGREYYVLGANIFSKVTDTAETDNLELLQNALKKNNERQISKYLDKLIRIANNYRVDAREHYRLQDKMFAFIDDLEKNHEDEYNKLQTQVFKFDELCERYGK